MEFAKCQANWINLLSVLGKVKIMTCVGSASEELTMWSEFKGPKWLAFIGLL